MTVVLCYWTDNFSIVATDTKLLLCGEHRGDVSFVNDDAHKLKEVRMGWAAGAGCHELINDYINKLRTADIDTQQDITKLYLDCLIDHVVRMKYDPAELNQTGIALSTLETDIVKNKLLSTVSVYSLYTSPQEQSDPRIGRNQLTTLYPYEYLENKLLLNAYCSRFSGNLGDDLNHCIVKICEAFQEIQSNSQRTVSRICDICIVIIDPYEIRKIRIKDSVDIVISDAANDFQNARVYENTKV